MKSALLLLLSFFVFSLQAQTSIGVDETKQNAIKAYNDVVSVFKQNWIRCHKGKDPALKVQGQQDVMSIITILIGNDVLSFDLKKQICETCEDNAVKETLKTCVIDKNLKDKIAEMLKPEYQKFVKEMIKNSPEEKSDPLKFYEQLNQSWKHDE
jgi:hypothetical protein